MLSNLKPLIFFFIAFVERMIIVREENATQWPLYQGCNAANNIRKELTLKKQIFLN